MALLNLSLSDIISRIYVVLPTKFSRETTTELYAMIYGIGNVLKINSDQVDQLIAQTNLTTASGTYVDDYISDLSQIGRRRSLIDGSSETDANYKQRFFKNVYEYNSTHDGLQSVVFDLMGTNPYNMYVSTRRGLYLNARGYCNDAPFTSIYGDSNPSPYIAYIEFARKPNEYIVEDICKTVAACKASGIRIYLKYPVGNPLEVTDFSGTYEETILV